MGAEEMLKKILAKLDGAGKSELHELLEPSTVADLLHVKVQTLSLWRCKSIGPDYVRCGSCIRYTAQSVAAYIDKRTVKV